MASKIILKKSSVASKVPLVGDLEYGELALNYTDGKLYYKDATNSIKNIIPLDNGSGALNWQYANKSKLISAQDGSPSGLFFKPDGTKLFLSGYSLDAVFEYAVSTPWDITTATYTRTSATLGFGFVSDVFFKPDGLKMYITDINQQAVYEYNVTTAWDMTAVTFVQTFSVSTQDTAPTSVFFKSDGLKMYVSGSTNNRIYEYNLSSAWNISTAVFSQFYSVSSQSVAVQSVQFASDGLSFYIGSSNPDYVYYYTLTSAWNISTASYTNRFFIGDQEISTQGILIEASQNKAWLVGNNSDTIYEYTTNGSSLISKANNIGLQSTLDVEKNLNVTGKVNLDSSLSVLGQVTLGSTLAVASSFSVSSIAGFANIGTSMTTGTISLGGTAQTGLIEVGRSTATQTLNLHTGATTTGLTKTINIGTAGLSGSTTSINIGSSVSGALGSVTFSTPTVAITNALSVGTINKLTLTTPATGATLTISDTKTISFPQSLNFPSTNGTNTYLLSTDGSGNLSWAAPSSGSGDMTKAVYDTTNNGKVDLAEAAESVPWSGITSVPLEFTPEAHTHVSADITDLSNTITAAIAVHTGEANPHSQYTTVSEIGTLTGDIHGVTDRTASTLSFSDATRTFTISPVSSSWTFYSKGTLYTVTSPKSIQIADTSGSTFIKFNLSTLTLEQYGPTPDFANDIIVAYIYWNSTAAKALILGDERHGSKRDTTWHSNQHLNVGTIWRSGGALTYTLNNASSVQIGITGPVLIADEDLLHTITHSATPSADYQQVLTTAASMEVLYLSGTTYTSITASTTPWVAGTSLARYNFVSGGSGSLVDAPANDRFITYWMVATNDTRSPIKLVLGREAHLSLDAAYAEEFTEYGLSFAEQVFMYQIVVQTNSSYTANTAKIVIAGIRKVLSKVASSSGTVSAIAHSVITGRDAADAHPISAITGLTTALSAKQDTLVSATNIKTINGSSILGSGDLIVSGSGGGDVTGPASSAANHLITFANTTGKLIQESTYYDTPAIAIPAAPAAGDLRWFARSRAGRLLPHIIGPSGIDVALQPGLFGNTIIMWMPSATTAQTAFGVTYTARNNGTGAAQATPARASTNAMTSLSRAQFGTGTTATGASGTQTAATVAWRGNAANLGGFFFFARFGIETLASDMRAFIGLSANNATMAADASTWANTIGIAKDSADSVWQLVQRNATTLTKTSSTATVTVNQILDFLMFAPPNASTVTMRLVDAVTGTVYVNDVVLNTTLPVNTTFMYMQAHTQSVTGTTAKILSLNRMYLEQDL